MKPVVTVHLAEGRLVAGHSAVVTVRVEFYEETKVNGIVARFAYTQMWSIGKVSASVVDPPAVEYRISENQTFTAGHTVVQRLSIVLPAHVPPSHELAGASAIALLSVHVDIPWAFDVRANFALPVHLPAREVVRKPYVIRTDPSEKRGVLEVSLASQVIVAGEQIVGKCAVHGVSGDQEVRFIVSGLMNLVDEFGHVTHDLNAAGWEITFEVPASKIGREVPFSMRLPRDIVPTFMGRTHSLRWILVGQTGNIWSRRELRIPLLIVPDTSRTHSDSLVTFAPPVGDERTAALFASIAREKGWRTVFAPAHDMRDTIGIEKAVDGYVVSLAYDNRGRDGRFVRGAVSYPPLGLGLIVNPSSIARHTFFHDIEIDIDEFDRRHHVVANDASQAIPYLRAVVTAVGDLSALGLLEQWTDTTISWLQPASHLEDQLPPLLDVLVGVAGVFSRAVASISPPSDITISIERWAELATSFGCHLVVGDLSISHLPRGKPLSVKIVRDDARGPTGVRVSWGDAASAAEEVRSLAIRSAQPWLSVPDAPPQLAELLRTTKLAITDFELVHGVASATLGLGTTTPRSVDVDRVREVIELLRTALALLTPQTGPYR